VLISTLVSYISFFKLSYYYVILVLISDSHAVFNVFKSVVKFEYSSWIKLDKFWYPSSVIRVSEFESFSYVYKLVLLEFILVIIISSNPVVFVVPCKLSYIVSLISLSI